MTTSPSRLRVPIEPQSVDAPLTASAVFLVLGVADRPDAYATTRSLLASVSDVAKNVAFRDLGANLSWTVAIGSRVWDAVTGLPRPRELHPFRPIRGSTKSHKTLATIVDETGERDILRDNMPFGSPASGEFGTYFIGYSRYLWVVERMLERMFIGDPPGLHDRLLDFSTPLTGSTFFAPSAESLEGQDVAGIRERPRGDPEAVPVIRSSVRRSRSRGRSCVPAR